MRAAAAAFEVNGYGATRLQDITAREDVSKGALYFHFSAKEALAAAIVGEYSGLWERLTDRLRPRHPRAVELLIELSWAVGAAFRDDVMARAGIRLVLETRLYESRTPPPYERWTACIEEMLEEAARQDDLAPGVDVANVAWFMVASFTGLQQVAMADGGPGASPDECVAAMWRCMLPGLVRSDRLPGLVALLDERVRTSPPAPVRG
ncbi:hypothetical protein BJF79_02690 [Actinomadura sp. CNU-125]|nr:hypothetical protein BJF79_02690 [Actinomadura sp. CNU-125]